MFPQGVNIALGLSYMLCTLLQIVGFGTPAWVVSDYNGEIFDSCGLLFCVSCRNGSGCETKTYLQTYQEYNTADGELVFADQVRETLIASLSVATAIIASLIWTIISSTLIPILKEDTKTYRFPYALFLSALGSFGAVFLAIIYLVRVIKVMSALSPSYQPLK
uniref:Uncharacterized protein n=1 Tax=Magallana gigas TaxID=29159 RepID=A0A8W8K870_MAGGI